MAAPLGGFARRASYLNEFRRTYPNIPILQVDTGSIFAERSPVEHLINAGMIAGGKALNLDLINLSVEDLYHFSNPNGKPQSKGTNALELPFVSANIKSKTSAIPSPPSYVIKTIGLEKNKSGSSFKIAFIGVADDSKSNLPNELFEISEPLAAVKKLIPDVRPQCDLLVVLADLSMDKAVTLAIQNGEVDLVITADKIAFPGRPQTINNAIITNPANLGRFLGEVRAIKASDGKPRRYEHRQIMLDFKVPDDPAMKKLEIAHRTEISQFQRKLIAEKQPPSPAKQVFALAENCSACHSNAFEIWKKTKHASALQTLKERNQEFNPKCLICHTTGFSMEGGFENVIHTPKLADVQCEVCHGAGLAHIKSPVKGFGKAGPNSCLRCHTSTDSPNFDFAKYWQMIKH